MILRNVLTKVWCDKKFIKIVGRVSTTFPAKFLLQEHEPMKLLTNSYHILHKHVWKMSFENACFYNKT